MLTGDNGILTQAQNAKKQTEVGSEKEAISLAYSGAVLAKVEEGGGAVTASDLENQFNLNGVTDVNDVNGDNPITVTFENGNKYSIDSSGNITKVEPPKSVIPGKYYEEDTDVLVGDKTVAIPGGATVSGIDGENESIDDGFVIYITNGEGVDWNKDDDTDGIKDVQETYDQFVWVPVEKAYVTVEEIGGDSIDNLKTYIANNDNKIYPMAIKISDSEYKGILYDFEEETNGVTITPYDYNANSDSNPSYREPDVVSYYDTGSYASEKVTKSGLQAEFKEMVEGVATKGGFWVGRYETSNMVNDNTKDSTNVVKVVKGTISGINNANWYRMYAQQKNYKNNLKQSKNIKSSMIWGSQWDQIMIWMKDIKNGNNYYITNSIGFGNFGLDGDKYQNTENPAKTGCFEVKKIYDLAGNVWEWTLEAHSTNGRVYRRRFLL